MKGNSEMKEDSEVQVGLKEVSFDEIECFYPGMTIAEAERLLILKTLEHTRQNKTRAAQLLGISSRTLRNKIHIYRDKNFV